MKCYSDEDLYKTETKKACQVPAAGEQWAVSPGGDTVPRPAHLQPWRAPQSTHQPCKCAGNHQARCRDVSAFCNTQSWGRAPRVQNGLGRGGRYCCLSLCCPFTDRGGPHPRGAFVLERMLQQPKMCPDRLISEDQGSWSFNHSNDWKGITPGMNKGWCMKRWGAALRRTSGCWRVKGWTWPSSVCLQPRNPSVSWAPSEDSYLSYECKYIATYGSKLWLHLHPPISFLP